MTVLETKNRIEKELSEIIAGFGKASDYVKFDIQIGENEIENAPTDITYVLGSLIIGKEGASDDEKLYLPLDADLDDDDNVDEEKFNHNLERFKEKVAIIRERLLSCENIDDEVTAIITEIDHAIEESFQAEIERRNQESSRNLIYATIGAIGTFLLVAAIFIFDKLL